MKKLIIIDFALFFFIPTMAFADLGPRPPKQCHDYCVQCYDCKTFHEIPDPSVSHYCRHAGCSCSTKQRKELCKAQEEAQKAAANEQPQNDAPTPEVKDAQTGADNPEPEIKDAPTGADNPAPEVKDAPNDSAVPQDLPPVQTNTEPENNTAETPAPTPDAPSPVAPAPEQKSARSCTTAPYESTAMPLAILLMLFLMIIGLALPARKR